jgi:hypothetical protein
VGRKSFGATAKLSSVLTVGVKVIPKIKKGMAKQIKCEGNAHYFLQLSRFGVL